MSTLTSIPEVRVAERQGVSPRPLSFGHFQRVAENGFGDGSNSYAYSSCWYDDHLYIGSNRDILPLLILRLPFDIPFRVQPVRVPKDYTGLDLRGQIWRYNPRTRVWQRVYQAPMLPGYQGRMVPEAFGFRAMSVFQGTSDERPAIYTLPFVGRNALDAVALRSIDGLSFHRIPPPCVPGLDEIYGSFRSMTVFKGRLFASPSSSKPRPEASGRTGDGREIHVTLANTARASAVLCTSDPVSGNWELSSQPLFGDRTNSSIFDMVVCGDYLYSGAFNLRHGFQIYRTTAEGPPPHHWEKVLDLGADRGALNQSAISMTAFRGALYVGTCIQNSGFDPVYQVGPAAGEVLRIYPDKTWDLLVGEPRMTRQGLKIPSSGMRAGFDNPLAGYIWRMTVHDDTLYVGTCDNSAFVPFSKGDRWPQHARFLLDSPFMERYMSLVGGCELWRTTDGNAWTPITRNGFGNPYNLGIRTLISTPVGLFVGTANPFGPDVAVRGLCGWEFQNNPRGGTEIWHGTLDHAAASPPDASKSVPSEEGYYRIGQGSSAATNAADPFLRLASTPSDLLGLTESVEDELDGYFGGSLRNVGYWRNKTTKPCEASRALIGELRNLLRGKSSDPISSILGVSLNPTELAAELLKEFPEGVVRAGTAEELVRVKDGEYDAAVWLEGSNAPNRQTILPLIAQRLRSGGCAVFADGIRGAVATGNNVPNGAVVADSSERFVADLANAGFVDAKVLDVTTETWLPFFNHSRNYFLAKLLLNQIDSAKQASIFASLPAGELGLKQYILVSAFKPRATDDN
jgi:hypothetical protein